MGRDREKEGEKHQLVASHTPPTRDQVHNPGLCPDQESNREPLICWTTLNPLSHTSQGRNVIGFLKIHTQEIFYSDF